ncbi:MAG: sugar-binding domain-containing protein [Planctomycetota bacterium]
MQPTTNQPIPRPEHPRPQFVRDRWLNLNGAWQFEIDPGDSGLERGLLQRELASTITVPFCPESSLSGVGTTDVLNAVWYRRRIDIPAAWSGSRIMLRFQAVDYDATVWVNGCEVTRHRGGFTSFSVDITDQAAPGGSAIVVVRARDSVRGPQARGKQSQAYANSGCLYTRTTGIWQTVWIEAVPQTHLGRARLTPDVANGVVHLQQPVIGNAVGWTVRAILSDDRGEVARSARVVDGFAAQLDLEVPADRRVLWEPGRAHLYDLAIELLDSRGAVIDRAQSYTALRSVQISGKKVLINGRAVFQRLVLDQGLYPDGLMTAPTDAALVRDIELAMAAGFNGARLHQKVFEERFHYHADRLGYLTWGEFADWGCAGNGPLEDHQQPNASYVGEWMEAVERDYSHPSIIGWCPLNETWQHLCDRTTRLDEITHAMFLATKAFDSSRPVIDASGYAHRVAQTDIYDSHDYEQDPTIFAKNQSGLAHGKPQVNTAPGNKLPISLPYAGQPFFVSEFGGIWWNPEAKTNEDSWGYGKRPTSAGEFYERFAGLCAVLLDNPDMFGYCYTQLTDVFQEQNGIYRFDRTPKLDLERIRAAQVRTAAIERGVAKSAAS